MASGGEKTPKRSKESAAETYVPEGAARRSLPRLREAAQKCRGCALYRRATQAVFGEGPRSATLLFVGEQPGDQEDLAGHPFVGPAGKLLDEALAEAGIPRKETYVTNAVKHFKWEPRGKRRLHAKPKTSEIRACFAWLEAEMELLRPSVIVCLGATAAQSVFGKIMPVLRNRGKWLTSPWSDRTLITVHPSSILRQITERDRHAAFSDFVADLRFVRRALARETK